jgi:hypothetical protein
VNAASIVSDVHNSGYSQEHELEADQLGIEYVIRAGFDPAAALEQLKDFERYDSPSPFMRTHPYISLRRQYLERYLNERGALGAPRPPPASAGAPAPRGPVSAESGRAAELRRIQRLYPEGSVSWKNLQRQIDAAERH